MSNRFVRAAALFWAVQLMACGGQVVFDQGGNGGAGGAGAGGEPSTSTSSPSTSTAPGTTSTGTTGCDDHQDCGPGNVCLFGSGECVPACGFDEPCPTGFACDECGTSSCPECADCRGACFPAPPAACDEHLDCGMSAGDDVCVFSSGTCAQRCGPGSPPCPPELVCFDCATSSCPGCDDCLGACGTALP